MKCSQKAGVYVMVCPGCARKDEDSGKSGRQSSHVQAFADAVWDAHRDATIIWDWNCIANDSRSSIDATVICGQGCVQFEIDGAGHFLNNLTNRKREDELKDQFLNEQGLCVLRLHFRDQDRWGQYIERHLCTARPMTQYTESYKECLMGDQWADRIMKL